MKILIIGEEKRASELKSKLPSVIPVKTATNPRNTELKSFDFIFDLNFDDLENPGKNLEFFSALKDVPVIVGAVKKQIAEMVHNYKRKLPVNRQDILCKLIGMNTLSTFINRSKVEISLLNPEDKNLIKLIAQQLNWEPLIIEDRVGMVTPRIVLMIINEACYTLQEGTSDIRDIDMAMKLGTNYPFGPLEWADKIGVRDVYETLLALYDDTKDERYKICPLLKTKYLKGETFY